jgi:secreted trypsin-like serine protease
MSLSTPLSGRLRMRPLRRAVLVLALALPIMAGAVPAVAASPDATPRIVGGTKVTNGKYPFQAALLAQSLGTNDFERQFCGGSLIGPWYVLTAAHCVDFIGEGPGYAVQLSDLRVVVGRTLLSSDQGVKRRVSFIQVHPRWDPFTARFDAAIIVLRRPITTISPIALPTPGTDALERPGRSVTVSGWGNTTAQPGGAGDGILTFPDRLHEVTIPLVSWEECASAYAVGGQNRIHRSTMLCAGVEGRDSCQGDSGGPLFLPSITGGYIQLGIVSWGTGCGARGFPGVYARTASRAIGNFIVRWTGGVPAG